MMNIQLSPEEIPFYQGLFTQVCGESFDTLRIYMYMDNFFNGVEEKFGEIWRN